MPREEWIAENARDRRRMEVERCRYGVIFLSLATAVSRAYYSKQRALASLSGINN